MTYYVTALSYEKAKELIKSLKNAGIEAHITVGGVSIYCEEQDRGKLLEICADFGTTPSPQRPFAQRLVLDRENTLDELRKMGVDV